MAIERIPIESREKWLNLRMADITASDLGALFGVDPRKSPRELFEEKASGLIDDEDSEVLRRGRWQEAAVAEMLAEHHPDWTIDRPNEYIRDSALRLGATTDRVAKLPGGEVIAIECKSVVRSVYEDEWLDGPPIRVQLQALDNAMLRGLKRALVAVLIRDIYTDEPQEFWVERHAGAEARIISGVRDFWTRIESSDPPPFDFNRDKAIIAALYPKGGGDPVDLSSHNRIAFLCEEKLAWAARRSAADKAVDVIDAEITSLLGDADRGAHPDFNITWKAQKTGGYTVPLGSTRVLRVTRRKPKIEEEAA